MINGVSFVGLENGKEISFLVFEVYFIALTRKKCQQTSLGVFLNAFMEIFE